MKISKKLNGIRPIVMLALMLLLTTTGFSQDPGDNPDGPPPAVPFDDYMHLIILAVGAVMAFITVNRLKKKEA